MKPFLLSIICSAVLLVGSFTTAGYCGDVKVMRGITLFESGEDCKLISEADAYRITPQNAKESYSKAVTLKQMAKEGWKIVYVKELPQQYSTEFLFIFTKD